MEYLLLAVIGLLFLAVLALGAKVYYMRLAAREIARAFAEKLATDTNTLVDISSRDAAMRQLAEQVNVQLRLLRQERCRYQQGDRELKEAVANISHDLRTPLAAICGYLELLEREPKSLAVQRYLAQVQNGADTLKQLTEELFQYSIAASVQALKREPTDLVCILEQSLLSFYAAMQQKGIQPTISLPQTPVVRSLDAGAVQRVFCNIIGNALKYTDGDLAVHMDQTGKIVFANTAHGLDAVAAGRLFDRFYTVQAGRNATGLGLAIARLLTRRMGGSIEARYANGVLQIVLLFA